MSKVALLTTALVFAAGLAGVGGAPVRPPAIS